MKFLTIALLTVLASCSTTNNLSQKSGGLNVSLRSNLEADVEVDMTKKIVGKAHHVRIFGIHTQSSTNYADGVTFTRCSRSTESGISNDLVLVYTMGRGKA